MQICLMHWEYWWNGQRNKERLSQMRHNGFVSQKSLWGLQVWRSKSKVRRAWDTTSISLDEISENYYGGWRETNHGKKRDGLNGLISNFKSKMFCIDLCTHLSPKGYGNFLTLSKQSQNRKQSIMGQLWYSHLPLYYSEGGRKAEAWVNYLESQQDRDTQ